MQVADQNMINLIDLYFYFMQSKLGSFTAIDQEMRVVYLESLCGLVSVKCRSSRI